MIGHVKLVHAKGNERDQKCSHCIKQFTTKNNLSRHVQAVHLKLQPFKRNICEKAFTQEVHVKGHIQLMHAHKTVTDQICSHCKKPFATKNTLTRHVQTIHLKIRPFK